MQIDPAAILAILSEYANRIATLEAENAELRKALAVKAD